MTQEDKQLLLIDLCARLPYGVIIEGLEHPEIITIKHLAIISVISTEPYKPYLRPMSSMTEEEADEFRLDFHYDVYIGRGYSLNNKDGSYRMPVFVMKDYFDWLNAHHFDYRDLIKKGLAIEAPEGMYKFNK